MRPAYLGEFCGAIAVTAAAALFVTLIQGRTPAITCVVPSAQSVETLFAPCQALAAAQFREKGPEDAVSVGLGFPR